MGCTCSLCTVVGIKASPFLNFPFSHSFLPNLFKVRKKAWKKRADKSLFFFFFSPPNNYWVFFGREQIKNAAVFVIIRLERLPSCNSITAAGIVGNAMQIAPKALGREPTGGPAM